MYRIVQACDARGATGSLWWNKIKEKPSQSWPNEGMGGEGKSKFRDSLIYIHAKSCKVIEVQM